MRIEMRIDKPAVERENAPGKSAPQAGLLGACATALGRMAATLREIGAVRPLLETATGRKVSRFDEARAVPHLSKLTNVVESTAHHVARAEHCHRGAGIRIDAALYELEQLRMELQSVLDPALLQGTNRILDAGASSNGVKSGDAARPETTPATAARAESARPAA